MSGTVAQTMAWQMPCTPVPAVPQIFGFGEYPTSAKLNWALAQSPNSSTFGEFFVAWFLALPTALPPTARQPWNNGGTLALS